MKHRYDVSAIEELCKTFLWLVMAIYAFIVFCTLTTTFVGLIALGMGAEWANEVAMEAGIAVLGELFVGGVAYLAFSAYNC